MTRAAPIHVNQFAARGRFPDGSSSAPYDCMVAAGVMELDAATAGHIRLTTTQLRARQSDQAKGIGLPDVARAFANTPGAPRLDYGTKSWGAVDRRLADADGAILTGYYVALGRDRAPGSSFRGPHAIYAQRRQAGDVLVNDPLRPGPAWIRASSLQLFYASGIGQAGWSAGGAGTGVPASSVPPAGNLGAFGDQVSFPVGHVITAADIDTIMLTLVRNGWFPGPGGPIAQALYRGILERDALGQPWTKALQDRLAADAMQSASGAADPFGIGAAVTSGVGGLVAGFGQVFRNGILLVAILGLVIMGLWLVATATDNPLGV